MTPYMPKWQSYIATTTRPMFTTEQCKLIIQAGHQQKPEQAKVGGGKDGKHDTKKRVTTNPNLWFGTRLHATYCYKS